MKSSNALKRKEDVISDEDMRRDEILDASDQTTLKRLVKIAGGRMSQGRVRFSNPDGKGRLVRKTVIEYLA